MKNNKPRYLYKYFPFSKNSITTLINEMFWFSNPKHFNDPFDCAYIDLSKHSNSDALKTLNKYKKTNFNTQVSYKNINAVKNTIDDFLALFKTLLKKSTICCFSETYKNTLLWSHYAKGHKGFCLEFEVKETNELFEKVFCVDYINKEKPIINIENCICHTKSIESLIKKYLATKNKDWHYEKEWRLIYERDEGLYPISARITSIIFGWKASTKNISTAKTIFNKKSSDVSFYKIKPEGNATFNLNKIICE